MNTTTKTALSILFTFSVLHLVMLSGAVLLGTPPNSLVAYGAMDGRNWMWIPVFFWAFIPTLMMLSMCGLAIWVTFKYSTKKRSARRVRNPGKGSTFIPFKPASSLRPNLSH